jgi:Domain of unknown function (DUF3854)
MSQTGYLKPAHRAMLETESRISAELIEQRGYETIDDAKRLEALGFSKHQRQVPGLLIPVHGVDGQIVSHQYRPDNPRRNPKTSKPIKYENPTGSRSVIDVPPAIREQLKDPAVPLLITEGIKKADAGASHGLCVIDLLGVYGFRGTNEKGGKTELSDWGAIALNDGRPVYVVFDSDVTEKAPVATALRQLVAMLKRKGANVTALLIPTKVDGKTGLDDYLANGGTWDELKGCPYDIPHKPSAAETADELPVIVVRNVHEREVSDQTVEALLRANNGPDGPTMFIRDGRLNVIRPKETGGVSLAEVTVNHLLERMRRAANYVTVNNEGEFKPAQAPKTIADDILVGQNLGKFPPIRGITAAPILDENGTIQTKPGYYRSTRTYYHETSGQTPLPALIPSNRDDAMAAYHNLFHSQDGLLGEFPFKDAASKAHMLVYILTPFVREMISGPTPLFLFQAPKQGTGKSLLAETGSRIFAGGNVAIPTAPETEEEWQKRILSTLRDGPSHVVFDNVKGKVSSGALASALTEDHVTGRLLGATQNATYPVRCVWAMTANNAVLDADLARRTVVIDLDAGVENPGDLKHTLDLPAIMRTDRSRYVLDCLTILAYWHKNRVEYDGFTIGRYENWSRVLGSVLKTLGVPGFLANYRDAGAKLDPDQSVWKAVFGEIRAHYGSDYWKSGDALEALSSDLKEHLPEILRCSPDRLTRYFGTQLGQKEGQVFDGFKLKKTDQKSKGVFRWYLSREESNQRLNLSGATADHLDYGLWVDQVDQVDHFQPTHGEFSDRKVNLNTTLLTPSENGLPGLPDLPTDDPYADDEAVIEL